MSKPDDTASTTGTGTGTKPADMSTPAPRTTSAPATSTAAQTSPKSPKSMPEPTTYVDPAADVVLRSKCGREFRVFSYYLKACSPTLREQLTPAPTTPIEVPFDRKTLKTLLNILTNVSMPATCVWSQRIPLLALADHLGATLVADRALQYFLECADRDPWGAFVNASKRNFVPLARAALAELAKYDDENGAGSHSPMATPASHTPMTMTPLVSPMMAMPSPAMPGSPAVGKKTLKKMRRAAEAKAVEAAAAAADEVQLDTDVGTSVDSYASSNAMTKAKRVAPPFVHMLSLEATHELTLPYMLGLFHAVLAAARAGVEHIGWTEVARRFEPVQPAPFFLTSPTAHSAYMHAMQSMLVQHVIDNANAGGNVGGMGMGMGMGGMNPGMGMGMGGMGVGGMPMNMVPMANAPAANGVAANPKRNHGHGGMHHGTHGHPGMHMGTGTGMGMGMGFGQPGPYAGGGTGQQPNYNVPMALPAGMAALGSAVSALGVTGTGIGGLPQAKAN